MARNYGYSTDFDLETEKLFKEAIFLGEGHNGIVYEVPNNKAIKIFLDKKTCKEEAKILMEVKGSKYFPRIYKYGEYYIVREKIGGMRLDHYIQMYGLSERLSKNLYKLIKEFKKIGFTKLDARCRDIYVEESERLRVIDPKQCFTRKVTFPRHLMKGLDGERVLSQFLNYIDSFDKKTAMDWEKKMNQYFNSRRLDEDEYIE